jgi:hypothetical protein
MDPRTERRLRARIARAARASENPYEMTRAARDSRHARLRSQVIAENPDLSGAEVEAAVRLLVRAEMAALSLRRWPERRAGGSA